MGRNVIFVASSLKSASYILPLACSMSRQNRNDVHFAIVGRDDIPLEDLKKVNGVSDADCPVQWHDGRPDYAPYSSSHRMEMSVRASLGHLASFTRPQVIITDSPFREDEFFSTAIKDKTKDLGIALIELPLNAVENIQWLTKLDSSALRHANDLDIEILVHAPSESSGSLIRLLKSLQNADYFGSTAPRLTIELPPHIDSPTTDFLESFRWPPDPQRGGSRLTLRHRVNPTRLTKNEAAIRTIESYYPARAPVSHVLVLTPQAELSPTFYHYIVYAVLEYKYSGTASSTADKLLGVSLDLPRRHLNGSANFVPPSTNASHPLSPLFLWQAPNSDAALYFGDKWVEFHSFLTARFSISPESARQAPLASHVSDAQPSWMEYLLELMRARGYSMLYPSFAFQEASALVTIHTDLYQPPEGFVASQSFASKGAESEAAQDPKGATGLLTAESEVEALRGGEPTVATTSSILSLIYPDFSPSLDSSGRFALPALGSLQTLSPTGEVLNEEDFLNARTSYLEDFAVTFGGCRSGIFREAAERWSANDLFCLEGLG